MRAVLERFFQVQARGSRLRNEVLGGMTTFVTMAYIVVVNPVILEAAGLPRQASTLATILAAVFGSLLMGLYANRPIAVAPYMGENAFLAYSLQGRLTVPLLLGAVFVSGAAFFVLTLLRLRSWLAQAISPNLKHSFAAGIGLFLIFIGLYETRIIVSGVSGQPLSATAAGVYLHDDQLEVPPSIPPLKIGNFRNPDVLLAAGTCLLMLLLFLWRVPGGILLGMLLSAAVGYFLGLVEMPHGLVAWPAEAIAKLSQVAGQLDVVGILQWRYFPILLTLFLMSFLDTLATLIAVGAAGGLLDDQGNLPQIERPMLVDSLSCMFSGLIGTSTSGAFVESATGIQEGARTGLAAVVVALLFALSALCLPGVQVLQELRFVYGPALIVVGMLMTTAVTRIHIQDLTEALPALITIILMLFTFNIANGLTAGLLCYPLLKLLTGRGREVSFGGWLLGSLCLTYFLMGIPH